MDTEKRQINDHDMLVRLDEKVETLIKTVNTLVDGTASRIQKLEDEKANRNELELLQKKVNEDIEKRVNYLETSSIRQNVTVGIGIAVLSLLTSLLIYHMFK